jgi:uncharacterized RDD family membrane protein YckC
LFDGQTDIRDPAESGEFVSFNRFFGEHMDETEVEYAGFWIRVGASIIDSILMVAITIPLLGLVYGWQPVGSMKYLEASGLAYALISWVLPAATIVWFWTQKGATPGKMLLSLKIVDAQTGGKLTIGQSLGRYAGYIIASIPLCLGLLWVAFDRRKQGWHDKLAGTVVIRNKKRGVEPVQFPRA